METNANKGQETFKISGNWSEQSQQLKTHYAQLTDVDLKCEKGQESELLSRLESKLNKSRDEVIKIINNAY